ncbi:glycosyltransferase [Bacillus carboniphilus]|uniref:Glycosyltransferase n=1 Tax=Bacillus carboniphilus TaxID=86663 RepID=A0ABY9JUJ7_9BACI|nr:glycosyltransferase [Bacillus carboniphilus]WLR42107.1 glycosyltransferase [Bacillus carboniphilus]
MSDNKVSVICCYNKKDVLQGMLYKSLETQTISFEFIPIDNTNNHLFTSASAALNYGARKAKGEYVVFVHQDIRIDSPTFLESLIDHFESHKPCLLGLAGRSEDFHAYSNMKHGKNQDAGSKTLITPVLVQTLDECFIASERDLFLQYQFDECLCDSWHLYAVDLCLSCGKDGIKSYVVPEPAYPPIYW